MVLCFCLQLSCSLCRWRNFLGEPEHEYCLSQPSRYQIADLIHHYLPHQLNLEGAKSCIISNKQKLYQEADQLTIQLIQDCDRKLQITFQGLKVKFFMTNCPNISIKKQVNWFYSLHSSTSALLYVLYSTIQNTFIILSNRLFLSQI